MQTATLVVLLASFFILVTGAWAWRLTGNYVQLISTAMASFGLLFAAQQLSLRSSSALIVSLMCTLLLGGRLFGTWLHNRRQPAKAVSMQMIGLAVVFASAATLTTFCTLTRPA